MRERKDVATLIEWLDNVPVIRPAMIVGHSITKAPKVKTMKGMPNAMTFTSHYQSTPLWLIALTRNGSKWRCRVWLRNIDRSLTRVMDDEFVTERGAEWGAYRVLNRLTQKMRDAESLFIAEVEKAGAS
jgi:hypothetical protein